MFDVVDEGPMSGDAIVRGRSKSAFCLELSYTLPPSHRQNFMDKDLRGHPRDFGALGLLSLTARPGESVARKR